MKKYDIYELDGEEEDTFDCEIIEGDVIAQVIDVTRRNIKEAA